MKKFLRIMLCIGFVSSAGIALGEVVNLREIDNETLNGIMRGDLPHLALEISEGEALPLYLSLKGDFLELSGNSSADIHVKESLYFRNVEGAYQLRTASSEWKAIGDFLTGSAQIGAGVHVIGSPFVTLGAELYEKK